MESIKLNRVSTVEAVCTALESDILSLHFAPGEKITENDLSARYGVSRNTLREASAHLISQGYLTKVANKGLSVRCFTPGDVKEIFHLRALLELEAIGSIKDSQAIQDLYPLVDQMEQTDRLLHWDDYVRLDIRFHSGLVQAAGSPRLYKLYKSILTEVKLCIFQTRNYVQIPEGNSASHRKILDALDARNLSEAQRQLSDHITHVIKRYCAGLLAMDKI